MGKPTKKEIDDFHKEIKEARKNTRKDIFRSLQPVPIDVQLFRISQEINNIYKLIDDLKKDINKR